MFSRKVFLIVVALQSWYVCSTSGQCTLDIRTDLPSNDPVFLNSKGELWIPDGPSLTWKKGESTLILCPGGRNKFNNTADVVKTISCDGKNKLQVDGKAYNKNTTTCSNAVSGDVQVTKTACAKRGSMVDIGFDGKKQGFKKSFDVCFDFDKGVPIYTRHTIRGIATPFAASDAGRPPFKPTGIGKHVDPTTSYTQKYQVDRFTKILGDAKLAQKYLNSTSYLARGHLTPDHDGIFKTHQSATYFYMNVAPEWQGINGGNWVRLENAARAKATSLKDDLEVYTGIYGVAQLKGKGNKAVDLYLEDGSKIPVPKFYWKILKYKDSGIGFATINNPFEENIKPICKDICAENGWSAPTFQTATKGYTICCTVADLIKAIPDIPQDIKVKKVLNFK